jgi:hypothetical protein
MPEPGQTSHDSSATLLMQFLSDRDVLCSQCRYNLRRLQTDRCPECGQTLVLSVNVSEPKQRMLIAGLIGLSAGAGLSGLLLIFLLIQLLRDRGLGGETFKFLAVNATGLLIEGAAIWLWLAKWRRIRNSSLRARTVMMLLCCALTLLNTVVFSLLIK